MEDEIYFVICSSTIPDLPYLRLVYGYDEATGKLTMNGYSTLGRWTDATLFDSEEEARRVMYTNNPGNLKQESLSVLKIEIKKYKL